MKTTLLRRPTQQTLQLRKLTLLDRGQNLIYAATGAFLGGGLVYGVYILIFQATYVVFGHTLSLSNEWNNWPMLNDLPAHLASVHIGGTGGLGTWFVASWPFIQHTYFVAWAIGVLDVAIIKIVLNQGAGKPYNWFDKWTLWLHTHGLRVVPSRMQDERTTPLQYSFLWLTMLIFGLPGMILVSIGAFGGLALLHEHNIHGGAGGVLVSILSLNVVQIALLGIGSHLFFASRITQKPAEDMQMFFLMRRLAGAAAVGACVDAYKEGRTTRLQAIRTGTSGGREAVPQWWYPPNFRRLYDDMLIRWDAKTLAIEERSGAARWILPAYLLFGVLLALYGLYCKFWLPAHGGLLL